MITENKAMLITIPSIPLIIAICITLSLYLRECIGGITDDFSESLCDAVCYGDTWLIKEYGIVGCVVLRMIQLFPDFKVVIERI
jgi:hypothetical protein